jgi:hypothetical protein
VSTRTSTMRIFLPSLAANVCPPNPAGLGDEVSALRLIRSYSPFLTNP